MNKENLIALAKAVIQTEADAINALLERIDTDFVQACEYMFKCEGRIVVIGMGKSGHIGHKIAATLASTGSPAFFVHPGEASHGDLGMITAKDVVLALSNSGETDEILTILPIIKRLSVPLIAMTGSSSSSLAKQASVHLDISVTKEACPLGLAPTSSTTATLVMGDALAVALLESHQFTEEDFARSHPAGRLGKRLLLHVGDVMHSNDAIPTNKAGDTLAQALETISNKGLGMTCVVDDNTQVIGVFTDGDLRRLLDSGPINIQEVSIKDSMITSFTCINENELAIEAVQIMDKKRINALPVIDSDNKLVGALNMHDLLRTGVV